MEISQVYERLVSFIRGILNDNSVTVIIANQVAPRPIKPFITISIDSFKDLSLPMRAGINTVGIQAVSFNKSALITFESYCDVLHQAEELLNKIQNYLPTETAYGYFKGELAYMNTISGVSAIPKVIDANIESRAILEVEFYLIQTIQENVGLIEHIHITDLTTGKEIIINK